MELLQLNIANVDNTKGSINVNPNLIQEFMIRPTQGDKFLLTVTMVSGRSYNLADASPEGKYLFDSKAEAEGVLDFYTSAGGEIE